MYHTACILIVSNFLYSHLHLYITYAYVIYTCGITFDKYGFVVQWHWVYINHSSSENEYLHVHRYKVKFSCAKWTNRISTKVAWLMKSVYFVLQYIIKKYFSICSLCNMCIASTVQLLTQLIAKYNYIHSYT